MTKTNKLVFLVVPAFLLMTWVAGCGKKGKEDSKSEPSKKEATKASPDKTIKSAKQAPIALETRTNDKIGFSIQVPKKAKTLSCNEFSCTYSLVLPDGMFEIHTNVAKAVGKLDTIADAIRSATTVGQKAIADKKALPNGDMLVVKAPQGALQEVYYYAKGPKGKVRAKCSGPAKMLPLIKKICTSLEAK